MVNVKSIDGSENKVVGSGQGIFNTVGASAGILALLQNGGLGNILGGGVLNGGVVGNNTTAAATLAAEAANCCFVNKDTFYQTLIGQINEQAARDIAVERRFAGVESAIATNSAVGECNKAAINREFQVVSDRFAVENIINEKNLALALCDTIRATKVITPSQIGSTYVNPVNVLDQHEARIYDRSHCHGGWDGGCSPCGGQGYRGF